MAEATHPIPPELSALHDRLTALANAGAVSRFPAAMQSANLLMVRARRSAVGLPPEDAARDRLTLEAALDALGQRLYR